MSAASRRRTLPVRAWFGLAGIVVALLALIMAIGALYLFLGFDDEPEDRAARAAAVLEDDADRWHDPAWRDEVGADVASDDVDFVLFEDGEELYRNTSIAGEMPPSSPSDPPWSSERDDGIVRFLEVEGTQPRLTAYVYVPLDTENVLSGIMLFAAALGVAAAAVAWVFARAFIRPLRATRRAAHQVATGDLAVSLPRSRVTEVDEVNTTFDAMAAELRRSLERQAALEQERRQFIAAIAHDLRTPLFSLRGYLEGLESGVADTPQKRARYLDVASQKARTLDQLVDNLFEYARLEYLDQVPDRQTLDLPDLIRQLTDSLQPEAEARSLTLHLRSPDRSCRVEADHHQLTRAIGNLLDNALRHTPAGGRIDVSCGCTEDTTWFTVSDTGPGIPAADLPHLFQPLYRGDTTQDPKASGAGLGLAIAHRILASHGGDLRAENRTEGGASFTGTIG